MRIPEYTAHRMLQCEAAGRIASDMVPFCKADARSMLETIIETKEDLRYVFTKYSFLVEVLQHCMDDGPLTEAFKAELDADLAEYRKDGYGEFADDVCSDLYFYDLISDEKKADLCKEECSHDC